MRTKNSEKDQRNLVRGPAPIGSELKALAKQHSRGARSPAPVSGLGARNPKARPLLDTWVPRAVALQNLF